MNTELASLQLVLRLNLVSRYSHVKVMNTDQRKYFLMLMNTNSLNDNSITLIMAALACIV